MPSPNRVRDPERFGVEACDGVPEQHADDDTNDRSSDTQHESVRQVVAGDEAPRDSARHEGPDLCALRVDYAGEDDERCHAGGEQEHDRHLLETL